MCHSGPVSYMYMLPIVGSVRETAENENCYQADVLRPTCRVVEKIATIVISGVHLSSELSYLQPTSHSYKPLPWNHVCRQGQAMWCQLPTSPVLWLMRVPSSGSGPFHLGSPSPRCGLLMGQGPALCRSLQPMQGTIQ